MPPNCTKISKIFPGEHTPGPHEKGVSPVALTIAPSAFAHLVLGNGEHNTLTWLYSKKKNLQESCFHEFKKKQWVLSLVILKYALKYSALDSSIYSQKIPTNAPDVTKLYQDLNMLPGEHAPEPP